MNEHIHQIRAADFAAQVRDSEIPVVVDFFATWCGPCRVLARVLDPLAERYAGRVRFLKVDIDEAPEIAEAFGVSAVPTLVFFSRGEVVDQVVGLAPPQALAARIERLSGLGAAA
jgi:thioredoxin